MHNCRICKVYNTQHEAMFKYAARHWAHPVCWLERETSRLPGGNAKLTCHQVVDVLRRLPAWRLRNFPVLRVADWLEKHNVDFGGVNAKSWGSRSMYVLEEAIHAREAADARKAVDATK